MNYHKYICITNYKDSAAKKLEFKLIDVPRKYQSKYNKDHFDKKKNALSDQLKTSIAKERYYLKKLGKNF